MEKLNNIKQEWIENFDKPLIISGPCSAESEQQIINTAIKMDKSYIQVFRAGIWKPRTRANSFEGVGVIGLSWLNHVKNKTNMLIATEVANAQHVHDAIKHNVDILWIGARSTVNPFTVQEIANALEGTNKIILVKNPINPDLDLWIGALERLYNKNIKNLGVIHRGFSILYKNSKYRNQPYWKIALDFKEKYPNIPILCDPSHICGNRIGLFEIAKQAFKFNYNGLIIESHFDPDNALTDANQQITPEEVIKNLKLIYSKYKIKKNYISNIEYIRTYIDEIDQSILSIISERMLLSKKIGSLKKLSKVDILQINRWNKILLLLKKSGKSLGLSEIFIEKIFNLIHQESIKIQK